MGATIRWNLVPDMTVVILQTNDLLSLTCTRCINREDVLYWYEPDYDNVLTAIAINPDRDLKWLAKLPLLSAKGGEK